MIIVRRRPPLFDEIDAAFKIAGKPVLFAFGDTIFNPEGVEVSDALHAHEWVHGQRQMGDVEGWWRRYIADRDFRLTEELLAHKVEYDTLCEGKPRNERRFYLRQIAGKLSSPLYGRLISFEAARTELRFDPRKHPRPTGNPLCGPA